QSRLNPAAPDRSRRSRSERRPPQSYRPRSRSSAPGPRVRPDPPSESQWFPSSRSSSFLHVVSDRPCATRSHSLSALLALLLPALGVDRLLALSTGLRGRLRLRLGFLLHLDGLCSGQGRFAPARAALHEIALSLRTRCRHAPDDEHLLEHRPGV